MKTDLCNVYALHEVMVCSEICMAKHFFQVWYHTLGPYTGKSMCVE